MTTIWDHISKSVKCYHKSYVNIILQQALSIYYLLSNIFENHKNNDIYIYISLYIVTHEQPYILEGMHH